MRQFCMCWSSMLSFPAAPLHNHSNLLLDIATNRGVEQQRERTGRLSEVKVSASKSAGFASIINGCSTCKGQGAIECPGCKGTGRNKKNGNIFERWKCYDCQGFGLKSCPSCGKGGLTPEQRGER